MACTEFCMRLQSIADGPIPSGDQLIEHLQLSRDLASPSYLLGTWGALQSRECAFCQLVVLAILEASDVSAIDPEQPIYAFTSCEEAAVRISYPSTLGTQLVFIADEGTVTKPENGRVIDGSQPVSPKIHRWLHKCDEEHATCIPLQQRNVVSAQQRNVVSAQQSPLVGIIQKLLTRDSVQASRLRVIDVNEGCVKSIPLSARYIALSYVWGHTPMITMQQQTYDVLSKPGGLDTIRQSLPRTILDAIELVKSLGESYLWVDTLCLIQDDSQDVDRGIHMMNSIYGGSYFTIVAGAGSDSNAGLPRIDGGRRLAQTTKELRPGLRMAVIHSIDWHLSRSVYSTRGWTLQELVLPRRTVIFINDQVYFRCQEANWCEETWSDKWNWIDDDDGNISRVPYWDQGWSASSWAYQKLCEDYSERKLRSDGDALRAVHGVIRPLLTDMRTPSVEGLPGYYLDMFLLFISSDGNMRRRSQFASFSWAGWEGHSPPKLLPLKRQGEDNEFDSFDSLAVSPDMRATFAQINMNVARELRKRKRHYREAFGKQSKPAAILLESFEHRFRPSRSNSLAEEEMRVRQDPRTQYAQRWREEVLKKEKEVCTDEERKLFRQRAPLGYWLDDRDMPKFPPYAVLQFETIAFHLLLGARPPWNAEGNLRSKMENGRFDRIEAMPLCSKQGRRVGWLHPDNISLLGAEGAAIELIVMSRCQTPTVRSALLDESPSPGPASGPWNLLWVLHIEWIDGIAERRGVGQVLTAALEGAVDPKPAKKIVLMG
ncbi:heterokaryon incompatibility protein-domain-containing protein [Stachybotrys elegans]|uniref:Heterokaryon incompatibility protein-domain-containing protein n=1 Tax=Stachybotrys elegans TaxID=80388 RepID=A0A8K0SUC5_9HYPO|nr:heterokaryon incompatibility protein-domain-containing protein [Stachybotrys elegans]